MAHIPMIDEEDRMEGSPLNPRHIPLWVFEFCLFHVDGTTSVVMDSSMQSAKSRMERFEVVTSEKANRISKYRGAHIPIHLLQGLYVDWIFVAGLFGYIASGSFWMRDLEKVTVKIIR